MYEADAAKSEALSVAGVAVKDGSVLLGKRLPAGALGEKWEFPGGKVEPGENTHQCLVREFREELEVDIVVREFLTEGWFRHNGTEFRLCAYLIFLESEQFVFHEHSELRWFALDALPENELAPSDAGLLPALRSILYEREK